MFRFVLLISFHIPLALLCTYWMIEALRDEGATKEDRWLVARRVVRTIVGKTNCHVVYEGEENLPSDTGYLLMPNHQGRFDGLAVVLSHEKPLSFVLDEKRSDILVEGYFVDLTNSERISKTNPRKAFQTMKDVSTRVQQGDVFCIFPEGGHNDNCNQLQPFHTGCFHFMEEMQAPIVPCVLVDSWRVFNYQKFWDWHRSVTVKVFFLPPILPSDYQGMSKREMAELVKARISEKLQQEVNLHED